MPKSLKDTIDSWIAGLNPEARKNISIWDALVLHQHIDAIIPQAPVEPAANSWIIHQDLDDDGPQLDEVWHPPAPIEDEEPVTEVKKLGSTQKLLLRSMSLRTVYKTSEAALHHQTLRASA